MNDPIKQIATRLCGLRESLDLSTENLAKQCGLDPKQYQMYESGNHDIPMSALHNIAQNLGVELTSLLSGTDPHVSHYAITRAGQGINIERRSAYKYQSLSSTFQHRRSEPFIVEVLPNHEDMVLKFSSHVGQEFNYILEGELMLYLGDSELILKKGDSIYFDPINPHAMRALNNEPCKFLATITA